MARLAEVAGVPEPTELGQVIKSRSESQAAIDAAVTEVTKWYCYGFTDPGELAKLVGRTRGEVERRLLPLAMRRLRAGQRPDDLVLNAALAVEREMGLMRFAWHELGGASKPSVRVAWAYVIGNCQREIARLQGLHAQQRDQTAYLQAINRFISGVTELVAATNNPALLSGLDALMSDFIASRRALPASTEQHPEDAEYSVVDDHTQAHNAPSEGEHAPRPG